MGETGLNDLKVYIKGNIRALGYNFTLKEVECKCSWSDCYFTVIEISTLESLLKTRKEFGSPVRVNSGYRCNRHNEMIGGSEQSNHKIGAAYDITPLNNDITGLEAIARKNFKRVLNYGTFLHCDNLHNKELQDE